MDSRRSYTDLGHKPGLEVAGTALYMAFACLDGFPFEIAWTSFCPFTWPTHEDAT